MKHISIRCFLAFCLFVFGLLIMTIGLTIVMIHNQDHIQHLEFELTLCKARIPTIREIQEKLLDKGYDIGPKGIDGKMGEDTIKAWETAVCNQYAAKYFGEP